MSKETTVTATAEDIIEEARNGRVCILVDHEERENEGDLVIPGQMATPQAINFMATHGRGLICLALSAERIAALGLRVLSPRNRSRIDTAFADSIEAREGVTTGISVHDRARTVAVAIDPASTADDISSPGHVFPLRARPGGVLSRAGHTEAAVDIARLAGLNPSAVICEIMNSDGSMARLPDLEIFARDHDLKIGTIADLIAYRLRHETVVDRIATSAYRSPSAHQWELQIYRDRIDGVEHVALSLSDGQKTSPVLVRVHVVSLLDDLLGVDRTRSGTLSSCMERIEREGNGVIVLIRDASPGDLSARLGEHGPPPDEPQTLRQYGVGAGILKELGIRAMTLLTNSPPPRIAGIHGYGLEIAGVEGYSTGGGNA